MPLRRRLVPIFDVNPATRSRAITRVPKIGPTLLLRAVVAVASTLTETRTTTRWDSPPTTSFETVPDKDEACHRHFSPSHETCRIPALHSRRVGAPPSSRRCQTRPIWLRQTCSPTCPCRRRRNTTTRRPWLLNIKYIPPSPLLPAVKCPLDPARRARDVVSTTGLCTRDAIRKLRASYVAATLAISRAVALNVRIWHGTSKARTASAPIQMAP